MHEVREVDVHDDEILTAWWRVSDEVSRHDVPGQPPWRIEELRGYLRFPWRSQKVAYRGAFVDGVMVGMARVDYSLVDTPHLLQFDLQVLPDHRRNGLGTALLEEVVAEARKTGKRTLVAEGVAPAHGGPQIGDPGGGFAFNNGFKPALVNHHRVLHLPVRKDVVDQLEAPEDDYQIVSWRDHLPEEWIEDRARLAARMVTDAPMGDLDITEEMWSADRFREMEELVASMERETWGVGAVANGRLVAASEIAVPKAIGWYADQWDTIVDPDHRGHRLGLRIKLANLRALMTERPDVEQVWTYNAAENAPMIRVNDALGFEIGGFLTEWQRTGV